MSIQFTLFDPPKHTKEPECAEFKGKPRLIRACRDQYEMRSAILDDLLPKEHLARDVWRYVEGLNLSIVLEKINSIEGSSGRPAIDPKILLALWLFATLKSINSARVIEEYTQEHDAFKWICGGVKVNYHTISDFRSNHLDQLNELLTQSVGLLANAGIITLEKVSQDGMRVRANAGGSSFRREKTLQDHLILAEMLLSDLNEEAKKNPSLCKQRLKAAEHRARNEKVQQINSAINNLQELRKNRQALAKKNRKKFDEEKSDNVRASTTDPEARIMKFPCGGFRPAYNIQFASTNKGKAIIGVDVINKGTDSGEAKRMLEQLKERYNITPQQYSVDTGFDVHKELDAIEKQFSNCTIYMPEKQKKEDDKKARKPSKRNPEESSAVKKWRERMKTEEGKKAYQERCETAEFVNATTRNDGLQQFLVRGIGKVTCVALIHAIVHNMTIAFNIW